MAVGMKKYKNHIVSLFLFLIVGLKVVSLHAFTHFENDRFKKCEACEYVIAWDETSLITNDLIGSQKQCINLSKEETFYAYAYQFEQSQRDKALFCRPPPSF